MPKAKPSQKRKFWNGYLKLSLVTCPVSMSPATTETAKIHFRTLNKKTGNPVETRYYDSRTGRVVEDNNQVKGYEQGEGDDVLLEDDELEAITLETTRTIDIERFVARDAVGWVWFDKPHFLVPDGDVGEEAFAVIREAMIATKTVALSRLVLYRRERPIMLVPRDKGIIVWTLRYGDEVRAADEFYKKQGSVKVDKKSLTLISKWIDDNLTEWNEALVSDPIEREIKKVIASKSKKPTKKAKDKTAKSHSDTTNNVIDIMDALRRSVAARK